MNSTLITVVVHLHTILQRELSPGSGKQLDVTLAPGSTLADLIREVPVQIDQETILMVVNNQLVHLDHPLQDGDNVHLIPPVSGGLR